MGEHVDEIDFSEGAKRRPFSQPIVTCYMFIYVFIDRLGLFRQFIKMSFKCWQYQQKR